MVNISRTTQNPNPPEDSHSNAQIFSPPYLFTGSQPVITSAPASITYGARFEIGTNEADQIQAVTWIRLPSVTHSFDQNLRFIRLKPQASTGKIAVTAPSSPGECPPGHYMMFLLNKTGVPSLAHIVQISDAAAP